MVDHRWTIRAAFDFIESIVASKRYEDASPRDRNFLLAIKAEAKRRMIKRDNGL